MRVLTRLRQKPFAALAPAALRAASAGRGYHSRLRKIVFVPSTLASHKRNKSSHFQESTSSFPRGKGRVRHALRSTLNMSSAIPSGGQDEQTLSLTAVEESLSRLLLDVAEFTKPSNPSQLRFTGGWVRDKLLGRGSPDIDVGISDMTGYQFGLKMQEYLLEPGNLEKYGLGDVTNTEETNGATNPKKAVLGLHKIEANPEKSKHLETVTTKIFGLDIDLVNLRKETYTDESRNPQMEFGTPEEDALRRDATINAMFYNLQTKLVEDFTGQGRNDLRDKIIRTPLESHQTFTDDPLRVLRLIRFASRLDYSIEETTKESMKSAAVRDSLKIKITRERVGTEIEKMLKGPDPHMALSLIDELGLYNTVFSDPAVADVFNPEISSWSSSYDLARDLIHTASHPTKEILIIDKNDEYITWILSALTPFADAPAPELVKGKLPPPLAARIAREGIKATNKVCDVISASLRNFEEIISVKDRFIRRKQLAHSGVDHAGRDTLGIAIRKWGSTWRSQATFALLIDHSRSTRDVMPEWDSFTEHLRSLDILNAYDFKPIIDGKTLATHLKTSPGPWMKEALEVVMAWQLVHRDDASQEGAIEAVREHQEKEKLSKSQGELVADLVNHFLTLTIRPLFAKTAQTHADTITASARRVHRVEKGGPMPRKYDITEDENLTRPWKNAKDSHAIDMLQWIVRHLTPESAEKNWPLLVPPILTLLDDIDTTYKAKGCDLLRQLLQATSPSLLNRTGLADVFEQALKPSLSYLPTLTPEAESIHILNAAYPALFTLTSIRHSAPTANAKPTPPQQPELFSAKSLALINLLHTHIYPSLTHISPPATYPNLTATLLIHLRTAIASLGIDTVAQLIHLIPLLNDILTAPFAMSTLESLRMTREATTTLQTVVANAWPRMLVWRAEVLQGIVGAWVLLAREDADADTVRDERERVAVDEIRAAIRVCAEMVVRAVEAVATPFGGDAADGDAADDVDGEDAPLTAIDFRSELKALIGADGRLEDLFPPLAREEPGSAS